jgi:hypothetical protein
MWYLAGDVVKGILGGEDSRNVGERQGQFFRREWETWIGEVLCVGNGWENGEGVGAVRPCIS